MQEHFAWLGLKVRDRVTGFSGVASSLSFDLYGCVQVVITPPQNDKGELREGRWFDVARLEVVDARPVMTVPSFGEQVQRTYAPGQERGPEAKPARASVNPAQ